MKNIHTEIRLTNEQATLSLGVVIGNNNPALPFVMYLQGDLGAGKTTLVRGIVDGQGHQGHVKSPSYAIIEPYEDTRVKIYHFDLYRLGNPEELEYIGIRDYADDAAWNIFEWPDKGTGFIPKADMIISLKFEGEGRAALIESYSKAGDEVVNSLIENGIGPK